MNGLAGPRVLLVEDDEGDALLVRACLQEADVPEDAVLWRRTLTDGLAALAQSPQCVLLDLGLPDADGMHALLQTVAAAPDIPIIVLTGRHDQAGTEALAAGAQDYLVKDDITGDLLGRSIRYAVERKRAQRTSQQLREARLNAAEKSRLERGLLPTPLLYSNHVECSTYYQPGRDHAVLGGDFFDVVETPSGNVRVLIGDVMGHGPDEAALGVHLRVGWRSLVLAGVPDDLLFRTLAQLLEAEGGPARYVTACDVTVRPSGAADVRVAGHPAPIVCHRGSARYLDVVIGPPLGVELPSLPDIDHRWPATTIATEVGDALILYTDGLLDAHVTADDGLGLEPLLDRISANLAAPDPVQTWLRTIVSAAPRESSDDVALLVLAMEGENPP